MGWTTMGVAVAGGAQFLVLAILARYLIDAEMGVVQAALVVMGLGRLMVRSGAGEALVQRTELEPRHLGAASALAIALGLVLTIGVALTATLAARLFDMAELVDLLRFASLAFVIQAIGIVPESLLQRDLRFALLAKIEVVSQLLGFALVGGVLAYQGLGAWSFVIAFVAQACLKTLLMLVVRPPRGMGVPDGDSLRSILSFGGGLALGRITNYAATRGDYVVTSQRLGDAALGVYGNAYQLVYTPALLLGEAIDRVMFPVLAGMQTDMSRLGPAFLRGIRTTIIVTAPAAALGLILAPELVSLVLGPGWEAVVAPVQILAIGLPARTAYKLSDSLTKAVGVVYHRAALHALYAVMIVTGSWIGSRWGVKGVATGVLLAVTANHLVLASLSLRVAALRWSAFAQSHVRGMLLGGLVAVPAWLLAEGLRGVTASNLIVAGGTLATMGALLSGLVLAAPIAVLGCRPGQLFQIGETAVATASADTRGAAPATASEVSTTSEADEQPPCQGLVELIGLPGAGKSHVSAQLQTQLESLGLSVFRPDLDIDETTVPWRRTRNKIVSAGRTAVAHPRVSTKLLSALVGSGQRDRLDVPRRWINLLNTIGAAELASRRAAPNTLTLSSQGIAQSIWSAALMAQNDPVDRLVALCNPWCPKALILIDTDAEIALDGMNERSGTPSRLERIDNPDDRWALLVDGLELRDRVVDAIGACGNRQTVMHQLDNNRHSDVSESIARLAMQLAR